MVNQSADQFATVVDEGTHAPALAGPLLTPAGWRVQSSGYEDVGSMQLPGWLQAPRFLCCASCSPLWRGCLRLQARTRS